MDVKTLELRQEKIKAINLSVEILLEKNNELLEKKDLTSSLSLTYAAKFLLSHCDLLIAIQQDCLDAIEVNEI